MARHCREQAKATDDSWTASTLIQMAEDYELLARALDQADEEAIAPPPPDPGIMFRK